MAKKTDKAVKGKISKHARRREAQQKAFLAAYAKSGEKAGACRVAKLGRTTLYGYINDDPEFAKAVEEAEFEYNGSLEREASRRAKDGYDKPVFQNGKEVGKVRVYSDRLLELLLKSRMPEKYTERRQVEQISSAQDLEAAENALAELRERMNDPDYQEYLRQKELRSASQSGDVGDTVEQGPVEDGSTPGAA